jgi:hypothetical protein
VAAGFGLSGPAGAQETKAEKSHAKTILFLGDSITAAGGYVRIIEAELAKQPPPNSWKVINRGKSSETVSDLSEEYHPGRRPCLFARVDAFVAAVDNHQLRDRAGGGDLRDGDVPGGEGLAEGSVLECAVCRGDEGQDGDVFVCLRFSELNRL